MELGYTQSYSFINHYLLSQFVNGETSGSCVGYATVSWLTRRGKCYAQSSDVLFQHYGKITSIHEIGCCILQLLFSFVYPTAIVDDERLSAEEMDERRRQNIAYEYLCHLEEAKQWVKVYIFHPNESYGLCSGSFSWKRLKTPYDHELK